jgi:hypothetical protein
MHIGTPQMLVVDLGSPTVVNRIRTSGAVRDRSYFASNDNKTWTKLFDHKPSVTTDAVTSNVFNRVTARYIKGEYHDKTEAGIKILEVLIYGPGTSTVDITDLPRNEPPSVNDGGAPSSEPKVVDASSTPPNPGSDALPSLMPPAAAPVASMPASDASPSSIPSDNGTGPESGRPTTATPSSGCQIAAFGGDGPLEFAPLVGLAAMIWSLASRSRRRR